MPDDAADGLQGELALCDPGVPVLVAAAVIETVVQVDCLKAIQADVLVKRCEDAVQVVLQVISGVPDVAYLSAI